MRRHVHTGRILTIASLLCASASLGCALNQPSPLPLGRAFELRPGTSATLRDGLKVTLGGVKSDSRCPMDVLCIWEGDAIVAVSLAQPAGNQVERELHTLPSGSEASYLTYVVKLVTLAPYPRSDRQIRPDEYVATLTVDTR